MKNIVLMLSVVMVTLSVRAQQIVPLERLNEYRDSDVEIQEGTYFKDVNGLLNKYIGTWKGIYDKKIYTFTIIKTKRDFLGISKDKLLVRYLIASPFGPVIEDTRYLPDDNALVIEGDYISRSKGYYVLNYFGKNSVCGQFGVVFISTSADNKQLKLFLSPDKDIIDGAKCSKVADQILPTKSMFLTKQ